MVRTDANTNAHRRAEKVQMSAAPYRGAPIRTCPAPADDTGMLSELLSIADEVSSLWGDSDEARQRMRDEVMQTPAHLHPDLLEHFQQSYRAIQ